MKTIEPKQLHDRYGKPLGVWENTATDDETGEVVPVACCADKKTRCLHATPADAYTDMVNFHARRSYRLPDKEWLPAPKPCAIVGCGADSKYQVTYEAKKVPLCPSHLNEEGMKAHVERVEAERRTRERFV